MVVSEDINQLLFHDIRKWNKNNDLLINHWSFPRKVFPHYLRFYSSSRPNRIPTFIKLTSNRELIFSEQTGAFSLHILPR